MIRTADRMLTPERFTALHSGHERGGVDWACAECGVQYENLGSLLMLVGQPRSETTFGDLKRAYERSGGKAEMVTEPFGVGRHGEPV